MESYLFDILAEGALLQLAGLLTMALFFMTVGIREMKDDHPEGYLYLTFSVFLGAGHAAMLANAVTSGQTVLSNEPFSLWLWLVIFFAPSLILLFLIRGLFGLLFDDSRVGLVKLFFGLTLVCFLYQLGGHWPLDVRGILTVVWLALFFKTEMDIAS